METEVLPHVPGEALVPSDEFRFNRMYQEGVDDVLFEHLGYLKVRESAACFCNLLLLSSTAVKGTW
jgi:hypothetical protein